MNTFRKLLIDALNRTGGYHGDRHDGPWPIEYTVGLYGANLDIDHISALAIAAHEMDAAKFAAVRDQIEWDEDAIWQRVQGDMYECLNADDHYKCLSPASAARFGFSYYNRRQYARKPPEVACCYSAGLPGWLLVDPYINDYYDCKFELHGRGGKHLVVTRFQGVDLDGMSSDALIERIEDPEGGLTNKWCQQLVASMSEWERCFTCEKASEEMEYQAAWQLASEVEFLEAPCTSDCGAYA